ncbi:MAG: protein phosphatase 2C domain-containing protein [Lachnospiraceae bacterium]|nr:protein phosphatase 2C domain-containing protein [Lachnospiraceae bacterium]
MNAKSFHFSFQGASHIKKNKECQDASSSYQDENCAIAIVCDGHGGDDYVRSAVGSTLGCGVAEKNIKNFIHSIDKDTFFADPDKHLKNLEASIINGWNEAIAAYHSTKPFQESELTSVSEKARKKYVEEGRIESAYGTTMIAVAMTHEYWFGIHIGDGKCVAVNPEGEFKQPIPWDPKCFLNATTSICDSDAIERFRHFYSEKLPAAVFVGSDGIDDCFSNNDQLHNLYKTMLYSFATTGFQEACDGLADYLPRLSAKGSGDDVSIAALLDLDLIPELSIVKEFDREKEKARVEENARKEAEKNEAEKRRVEEEHARFQQQNNSMARREQPQKSPRFCENCGERIKPGVKFCSNCGAKIEYKDKADRPDSVKVIRVTPFETEPDPDKAATEQKLKVELQDEGKEDVSSEDIVIQTQTDIVQDDILSKDTEPVGEADASTVVSDEVINNNEDSIHEASDDPPGTESEVNDLGEGDENHDVRSEIKDTEDVTEENGKNNVNQDTGI